MSIEYGSIIYHDGREESCGVGLDCVAKAPKPLLRDNGVRMNGIETGSANLRAVSE